MICFCFSDVDECASNIHNCVEGSVCINTNGYFVCLCPDSNGIMTNCTGMCKRRSVLIENGGWKIDNCINCTCLVSGQREGEGEGEGQGKKGGEREGRVRKW